MIALLAGCEDLDRAETVRSLVTWDERAGTFAVRMRMENVGAELFHCDQGVDDCVSKIRDSLTVPTSETASSAEESGLDQLGATLVRAGAREVQLRVERGAVGLDLFASYTTAPGTPAANHTRVRVERSEKGRRARTYLTVERIGALTVSPSPWITRSVAVVEDGERADASTYVFRPGQREVETVRTPGVEFQPILVALPGLDEALVRAGLLK
jgi:hypothetical protein